MQLRLAERREVLTGASLSIVQELGLQILMMVDEKDRAARFWDDLRSRIAAAHPDKLRDLFPEWHQQTPEERAYGIGPDGRPDIDQMDDSAVEWRVPETEAERRDLEQWLIENTVGTVTATELGGEWQ